ncbi:putative nuclease HARBI1 [Haliotis rubra]|uniref:putative nuclease HARBI1 n=1 Tax=Haliotis rubra TaxID=36100 RepID=UPI001EE54440|nr:putative nuclease HARBI1 [Haliotis rubra]
MQLCNADDMDISQPTVSRAVAQTLAALNAPHIVQRFVSFPLCQRQLTDNANEFAHVANFPNVAGVIDGTHVQIIAPHVNEPAFVNRKHYHSINTQLVFDAHYRITDVVAKWPGSTHDARILRESGLQVLFETRRVPGNFHLLGDSGYPSKTWLLTPYLRPNNANQLAYNRSHKRTRSIVERGIGQLKRRFHALHVELRLSPHKACQVIVACAVLHNICKTRNIPDPEESNDIPPGTPQPETLPHPPTPSSSSVTSGVAYRDQFARVHFS